MTDLNLTDVGNGRRLVALAGDDLRYVAEWKSWMQWDGRRWVSDTKGAVVEAAKRVPLVLLDEARGADGEQRKQILKWSLASEAANRIEAAVKMARTEPGVAISPDELDVDPWILNVLNGTVDLRTGALRPHDRRDLCTKLAPVEFDPGAAAPTWASFLERVLPDPEVREFVARFFGYCLTGDVSEHKLVLALGTGANGKSTATNVIEHVMGDYARQAAPDLLMRRRDDPHPTGLADLQGARLVLASETAQNRRLDEALVKRLTGGDRVKARRMHLDFFEFNPSHKLVVSTNHRPAIEGTDNGIWRRIRIVPFSVTIPDHEQDRHLEQKLRAEAPGILRWMIDGCLRWQADGLTEPTAVTLATADYRADSDVLGQFISDRCLLAAGVSARASDLLDAYNAWAHATGEHPISQRRLGTALAERGLTKRQSNGIRWDGIGLITTEHEHGTDGTLEPSGTLFEK